MVSRINLQFPESDLRLACSSYWYDGSLRLVCLAMVEHSFHTDAQISDNPSFDMSVLCESRETISERH